MQTVCKPDFTNSRMHVLVQLFDIIYRSKFVAIQRFVAFYFEFKCNVVSAIIFLGDFCFNIKILTTL